MSNVTFDLAKNTMDVHHRTAEPWRVTLVDTGEGTMTGGPLKRVSKYLDGEDFYLTYGDGVSDVDLGALTKFHRGEGSLATLTAVQPPGRFGALQLAGNRVDHFREKPEGDGAWVNGGFFILSPKVLDYIDGDDTIWEAKPLEQLSSEGQLCAFKHRGLWQPMDTLRDKQKLDALWEANAAPWKIWA
jgi:glucose-1-phosphate cytidylyltransferase